MNLNSLQQVSDILENKKRDIDKKIEITYNLINEQEKFLFRCTDHCILRYLQRVELIPVSQARYKILKTVSDFVTKNNLNLEQLKDVGYKLDINGIRYVIRNKKIVTIEIPE